MSNNKVVIIGAGLAGLFCALKLLPQKSVILCNAKLGEGASSAWAQGGIAAAVGKNDSVLSHVHDTKVAGAGIVDINSATLMAKAAKARIDDLINLGVEFDRNSHGDLILNKEAAHSQRRVVRVGGDMAGKQIMAALIRAVLKHPNITVLEYIEAIDLSSTNQVINGVIVRDCTPNSKQGPYKLPTKKVVLASGGIGQLYQTTTNPKAAKGDGLAMAARAGALVADAEFVQFHPTALNVGIDPAPLATEALRGEGALLVNELGARFMQDIHPDAELAPRDIVARAVFLQNQNGHQVFLDCRKSIGSDFKIKFPKVYHYCQQADINPSKELMPILAAAHYHMGGVVVDKNGNTNVTGLWACGEVSNSGLHGANRLASNSLLEAVVYAANIATDIAINRSSSITKKHPNAVKKATDRHYIYANNPQMQQKLRLLMQQHVGVVRNARGLKQALAQIEIWLHENEQRYPMVNMLDVAKMIVVAALNRKESRGGHFRSDYPQPDKNLAKRFYYQKSKTQQQMLLIEKP